MIKSRSALRLGGALAIALAVFLVLSACAESSKAPDETVDYTETVEARLARQDVLAVRSLTVTNENYSLDYSTSDLYWTYTAVKADGYFTTGQSSFDDDGNPIEAYLNTKPTTDEDGNGTTEWAAGIPSSLPGKFSVGDWVFTFNAYTSADLSTDEDGTLGSLYYQGVETSVSLYSGSDNTVSVAVNLYEAVKDQVDGVNYGKLEISLNKLGLAEDFSVSVQIDDADATTVAAYTYSSGTWAMSEDSVDIMGMTGDAASYTVSLAAGYHTVKVTAATESASYSDKLDALVKANLTTALSGSLNATVSTADDLASALAISGLTVQLGDNITLTSSVTVSSDSVLDLNGNTLSVESTGARLFSVTSDGSLTIKDSGTIINSAGSYGVFDVYGTLVIEGGTFTDNGSSFGATIKGRAGSNITINGGTFSSSYDSSGSSTVNYNVCVDGGTLTITGGTFSADSTGASSTSGFCVYAGMSGNTVSQVSITGGTYTTTGDCYAAIKLSYCVGTDSESEDNPVIVKDVTINSATSAGIEFEGTDGVVESSTITVEGTNSYYSSAIAICYGSNVTVNSGTYTAPFAVNVYSSGGTVTINGGTFTGTTYVLETEYNYNYYGTTYCNGSFIYAYAGYFSGSFYSNTTISTSTDEIYSSITLYGGTYTADPTNYLAAGYTCSSSEDDSGTTVWSVTSST